MKRYISLLENNWREVNQKSLIQINELAKIISLTGLTDPEVINTHPELQKPIAELKNAIIRFYSEDVVESEIAERYIYMSVSGSNEEGVESDADEDGQSSSPLYHFSINAIQIAYKDDVEQFVDMTKLWGDYIEEKVLELWQEGWMDYYDIKSTEDTLRGSL